ncbi:DUF262 domain-containing protein [Micromonospora chalcea]
MTKELHSETLALSKVFSQEFFFRIPEYQRPFLWDDEHFSNLIDDLTEAEWDEPYFLGTLVLHRKDSSNHDVVDGQQRLTALCILLACIRDTLSGHGHAQLATEVHAKIFQVANELESIPAKSRLSVKDFSVFNSIIGKMNSAATPLSDYDSRTPSGQRYETARSIFWDKLGDMSPEGVKAFAKFVINQCTFIYLATNSFENAFRLFTVVNDRGKQLRRIDVLKAHNLDPKNISDDDLRTKYAGRWEDMETQLGETEYEEMFHLLRLIYVKEKPQSDLYTEFVKRILGKADMPKAGAQFIDELAKYVNLYDELFVSKSYLDPNATEEDFVYQTLMDAMVSHFSASEWKACLVFFADRFGKKDLYSFMLALEKVYLDHWVRRVRKDERYGTYTSILKVIRSAKTSAEVIKHTEIDVSEVQDACRATNFYSTGHAKYLLVRAELLASELDHAHQFRVRSIEHVLPQNPEPGGAWSAMFTQDEHKELVHSAGNLVLLSKTKNASAGRREFAEKKSTYLAKRVSDFPRSMQVLNYSSWTPEVVRKRTEEFAKTVLKDP